MKVFNSIACETVTKLVSAIALSIQELVQHCVSVRYAVCKVKSVLALRELEGKRQSV